MTGVSSTMNRPLTEAEMKAIEEFCATHTEEECETTADAILDHYHETQYDSLGG